MKYVSIENLKEGDIIAKGIEPFIKDNTPLTQAKIDWLKKHGKTGVYIKSTFEKDENDLNKVLSPIKESVPEQVQQDAVRAIYGRDIDAVIASAIRIVESICNDKNPTFDIWGMIDSDKDKHPIHVCEFAVAVAKKENYPNDKLVDVAVAALLHDIGKKMNKNEKERIINESQNLINSMNPKYEKNDENLHSIYGYAYLKNSTHIPATVKSAILYHHENENGTGYFGKKGDEIKDLAALIHICDDYENKLRIYANPIVAREHITAGVTTGLYKKDLTISFLKAVPVYPIGTMVKLSNGLVGSVYRQNDSMERPFVQLETGEIINLESVLDITITPLYGYGEETYERKL